MTVHLEFQAVVLAAGEGSKMYPLTEEIPKALLPVGNRPMIYYPIRALQKFGFQDVIVVARQSHCEGIRQAVQSCFGKMKFNMVAVPDDGDGGTVESLRYARDKIKTDVFVLSCDLICDVSLHALADVHRANDASLAAMFSKRVDFALDREATQVKNRSKEKDREQKDFVAIDALSGRLLFVDNESEMGTEYSVLNIRKSLLRRYPNLLLRNDLLDTHCYVIKPWVLDYLNETRSLDNIRSDVVPHLVRKQFTKTRQTPLVVGKEAAPVAATSGETFPDVYSYAVEDEVHSSARGWSSYPCPPSTGNVIRCHALVCDDVTTCLRVNTLPAYSYANRQATKILPFLCDQSDLAFVHPLATIKERSQVGSDSMVGDSVSVAEGVSIKRSMIGKHCVIGTKVKITNSVIMDHVTIREGCVINGCVICNHAYVAEKCQLKDCQVGTSHAVKANVELKGEIITRETIGFDD